jgi:diadenosine tetraphosphate (Ap4A) HIT family hydrolase
MPKKHYPSYFAELSPKALCELMNAVQIVAKKIDKALPDVGRTGLVFEGFGVDHIHGKLIPMHGTADMKKWTPVASKIDKYFEKYEGYLSSHDASRADDARLAKLADKIRSA